MEKLQSQLLVIETFLLEYVDNDEEDKFRQEDILVYGRVLPLNLLMNLADIESQEVANPWLVEPDIGDSIVCLLKVCKALVQET